MKIYFCGLLLLLVLQVAVADMLLGGLGDEKGADDNVKSIVTAMSGKIKSQALETFGSGIIDLGDLENAEVEVISYKTQLVAGVNYFTKLRVSGVVLHAKIYKDLKGNMEVVRVIGPKALEDKIEYF